MGLNGRFGVATATAIYIILSSLLIFSQGQRIPMPPPPPQPQPLPPQPQPPQPQPKNMLPPLPPKGPPIQNSAPPPNAPPPTQDNGSMNPQQQMSMVQVMQQQKTEELSLVKDESIKRVLLEMATVQTQSQMKDTLARVASLIGPLFYANFDQRKDQIVLHGRNASQFSQRLLTAVTDIQGEEVKALLLQKKLDNLHAADYAFLPLAIQYALQPSVLSSLSGTKLASSVRANPGDTNLAYKTASALFNRPEQQMEYLQSLGTKIFPDVQRIIINLVLQWWGDANQWKDRELSLMTTSGDPLLAYLPLYVLENLDQDMADRFTSILGQTNEIGKVWWLKPMSLKKAWFELAKGARYFGAVHEWSFRRMQKLSFLLEGASPEDLKLIPPIPEIKGLVIANHYTELQCRVVFDAFYQKGPLSQEDLQEFQFHILNLSPVQLQRFDLADSFSTLDEMMTLMDHQKDSSYATLLQISYFMWPLVNTTNGGLTIAPPTMWQKRELSQMGKFLFLLPKSTMFQIPSDLFNWDSNILPTIRSSHLSNVQIWHLTSLMLPTVDDRFKPDYVFMIPSPFQIGIPTSNLSQVLLMSPIVRPEVLRALIEESSNMLVSQKAVIFQRIRLRLGESTIIRNILNSERPSELLKFFNPRVLSKNMPTIIKSIMEMPETGRFGITSIQAKLLPRSVLSLWLNWVRENAQVSQWTAEDILGRSALGAAHEINLAVLGLSCRDVDIIDPLDILTVILHYRHELYNLRRFDPELGFNLDLRTCLLEKVLEYLKVKSTLNGTQSDSHILTGLNDGETTAMGGEILTAIPTIALQPVPMKTRLEIIKGIGRVEMMELFSMCSLEQLIWYANTLLRDIHVSQMHNIRSFTKRQAEVDSAIASAAATALHFAVPNDAESPEVSSDDSTVTKLVPLQSQGQPGQERQLNMNADFFDTMGNLLCYASEMQTGNWSKRLFRDILESKQLPGSKTCCMHGHTRAKWFALLQDAYGPDSTSWSEAELASIGDLLIAVPEQDLMKISLDSLSKAFNPITKQSGFEITIHVPGTSDQTTFIKACVEQLETEGMQYLEAYKSLMRRQFQAAQWLVNTVKTTNELIKDGVGRSGRVPRWAEFKLVRRPRQIPILTATSAQAAAPTSFSQPSQNQGAMFTFPQPMQTGSFASGTATAASMPQNTMSQQFTFPIVNSNFPSPSPSFQSAPMQTQNFQPAPVQNFQPASVQNFQPAPAQNFQPASAQNFQPASVQNFQPALVQNFQPAPVQNFQPAPVQNFQPSFQTVPTPAPSYQQVQPTSYPSTYYPVAAPATYYPTAVPTYQDTASINNYEPAPLSPTQILGNPQPSQFQSQQQFVNTPQQQFQNIQQAQVAQIPAFQQQYQQFPATQQQFPATQQQFPATQQQFPATQQQFPATQQQFPATQQQQFPATQQQQFPATQQQQFPATQQQQFPATQQQQFPATQQQFPATQQQFPATQQQYPATQQQFPATQQQFPATQQQFPATQQQFPATQQQFPATQQQFPATQQQFPATQQQFPATQQQFPATQQQFPATQQQFAIQNLAAQQQFTQQQLPATQQQFPVPNPAIQQQFASTQPQTFPAGSQQFPAVGVAQQQFTATQSQVPATQLSTSQQQVPISQQFANQPVQNPQIFQANQQQLGNDQQFLNTQQQPAVTQQGSQQQIGNIQNDGSPNPQNFGGVPGFNINSAGTSAVTTDQSLVARSLNVTHESATALNASNAATINKDRPRSIDFGSLQKAEAGQQPEITCHGIKTAGLSAIGLTMDDIGKLAPGDLYNCMEILGTLDYDENMKKAILNLLKEKLSFTAAHMDTATLLELGKLVTALTINSGVNSTANQDEEGIDISQLDMTLPDSLDSLSILGGQITDQKALQALAEKFNTDNKIFPGFAQGIARPDNLRIVVMALQNIVCGFSDKIVNSIFETDASLFLDVSCILGTLQGCSQDVLTTLASHAVRSSNYGPPRLWSQEDIGTIGVVFAGLKPEAVATVPSSSIQGLPPHAVRALSPEIIKALTPEQMGKLSYSAASSITFPQMSVLTESQREAVNSVLVHQSNEFDIPVSVETYDVKTLFFLNKDENDNKTAVVRDTDGDGPPALKGRSGGGGRETESTTNSTPPVTSTAKPPTAQEDVATTTPAPPHTSSADSQFSFRCKETQILIVTLFFSLQFILSCNL